MAKYEIDMCRGPLFKKIVLFSVPLIATSVLQLLYNAADVVVVGQFAGKEALAAVGSTGSLISLIINLFIGLSIGTSVAVSNYYGAGNREGIRNAVHTSIAISGASGVFLAVFGIFMAQPLLVLMDSPPDVIDGATLYMQIYFAGMPFNMVYNFGAAILRAVGDTRRPLYYLTFSGIINVVLNLVLVIVFHMGVAGVAIATVVSQIISSLLVINCLLHSDGDTHLDLKKLRIHKTELLEIARVGLPAGIQNSLFAISNVLIQSAVNSFGSDAVAGNSAASNLDGFVYCAMNAFHQAAVTFASQNLGAKQYHRLRRVFGMCFLCVTMVGVAMGALFFLFRVPLLSIYTDDPAVILAGKTRMLYVTLPYVLCGMMEVASGQMRGMGYSILPMIVSLTGACAFRVIWIYTFFDAFPTLDMLFVSYPVSWIITTAAHYISYLIAQRKLPSDDMPIAPAE